MNQTHNGFALILALIMTTIIMSLVAILLVSSPIFDNENISQIEKIKASELARLNLENFIDSYSNCTSWALLFNNATNNATTAEDKFCAASSGVEINKIKVKRGANYNFYLDGAEPPTYMISCAWLKKEKPDAKKPVATKAIKYSCTGNLTIQSYRRF
jgi:hypothetical protein